MPGAPPLGNPTPKAGVEGGSRSCGIVACCRHPSEAVTFSSHAKTMARKANFKRYTRGNIRDNMALGTLAAADVITTSLGNVNGRTKVSSIKAVHSMSGFTVIDNAGPIMVGVCHGDYSDQEVEDWIEQSESTSWDRGDLPAAEISGRKIRKIGTFEQVGQSLGTQVLNDGKPITTKLNWILEDGQSIRLWAYNTGTVAVGTTDPQVVTDGHANLWAV